MTPAHPSESPIYTAETSAGRVEIVFGVNGWVSVTGARESTQLQVSHESELARALARRLLLPPEEARAHAADAWRARPKDFALPDVHASDGLRRATGLRGRGVLLAFAALFAVFAIFAVDACGELRDRERERDEPPAVLGRS